VVEVPDLSKLSEPERRALALHMAAAGEGGTASSRRAGDGWDHHSATASAAAGASGSAGGGESRGRSSGGYADCDGDAPSLGGAAATPGWAHHYPTFSGAGFAPGSLEAGPLAAPSAYRCDPLLARLLPDGAGMDGAGVDGAAGYANGAPADFAVGMGGFELPPELVARLRLPGGDEVAAPAPGSGEADARATRVSAAAAAAPVRPLQAGDADFLAAVGRVGEQVALRRLRANLAAVASAGGGGGGAYAGCTAEWVNAGGETGRPYDIVLQREGKAVGFVEVKATTSLDPAHAFPFSVGEAAFAARNATAFHVCLVYGVDLHALDAGTTPPGLRTVLVQQAALQLNNAAAWPRFGLAVRAEGGAGGGGSGSTSAPATATAAL